MNGAVNSTEDRLQGIQNFSDDDLKRAILGALRLAASFFVVLLPLVWWKLGWRSAALFAVGTAISCSGIYEWLRLMTAVMARMDSGLQARPLAGVLIGFFFRLGVSLVVLYISLRFLHGSVYALGGGLLLGIFALLVKGLRLIQAWTL